MMTVNGEYKVETKL